MQRNRWCYSNTKKKKPESERMHKPSNPFLCSSALLALYRYKWNQRMHKPSIDRWPNSGEAFLGEEREERKLNNALNCLCAN